MVLTRGQIRKLSKVDLYECASWMNSAWLEHRLKCCHWHNAEKVFELYSKESSSPLSKEIFLSKLDDIIGILNWEYNEDYNECDFPKGEYRTRICPRRKKETLMIYRIKL